VWIRDTENCVRMENAGFRSVREDQSWSASLRACNIVIQPCLATLTYKVIEFGCYGQGLEEVDEIRHPAEGLGRRAISTIRTRANNENSFGALLCHYFSNYFLAKPWLAEPYSPPLFKPLRAQVLVLVAQVCKLAFQ
jgi:hypothetical protein